MNATGELAVRLIGERADVPLDAEQWNALVSISETRTVFQTFEWFDSWWRTFGDLHELFLLLVNRGEQTIACAAFMLTRVGRGIVQLEFVGTGNSDYQDVIVASEFKKDVVHAICAFLAANSARWQRAWLCNVPSESSTLRYLREAGKHLGLHLVRETNIPCPAMRLERAQEAARELLGKYSVRRPMNWFSRRGKVRFRHLRSVAEVETFLPQFFDQHVRRWAYVGKSSLFQEERQRSFYSLLARAAHECGWLLFSVVEFDDQPIAFHFGFDYSGIVTWYKPSFEAKYSERSPGMVLIYQLIEDSLKRGRHEIDFTIGDEPFKDRFANVQRSNLFLSVYHSRSVWIGAIAVRETRRVLGRLRRRILKLRRR